MISEKSKNISIMTVLINTVSIIIYFTLETMQVRLLLLF